MRTVSVMKTSFDGRHWYVFLKTSVGPSQDEVLEWKERMQRTTTTIGPPLFTAETVEACYEWIKKHPPRVRISEDVNQPKTDENEHT